MADHSKAHDHATKAAAAFKKGDGKTGRHHLGHAMMASRHAEKAEAGALTADDRAVSGPVDAPTTPAAPAKPAFNRARFGKPTP